MAHNFVTAKPGILDVLKVRLWCRASCSAFCIHFERQKDIYYLHDVEYAILEANGKISIIPKSQARAVKTRDMGLDTIYEGLPTILIEDGNIIDENLKKHGLEREWLHKQLKENGFDSHKKILVAMLDAMGRLYLSAKIKSLFTQLSHLKIKLEP
jgi:uncharacterized membrane protein YcaP (DUF421 family)